MRFARTIALVGVALLWFAFGPVVLLLAGLGLLHPATRLWLRPSRRVLVVGGLTVAVLAGLAFVVPDGRVRMPPGPGSWVTPEYVGRPTSVRAEVGPVGESPTVTARSYRVGSCSRLVVDGAGRLVALCGGTDPQLRLIDPDSLRPTRTTDLPGSGCPGQLAAAGDRVIAASGGRLLAVDTADLAIGASVDVSDKLNGHECITGVGADGGRVWFVTSDGVVGVVTGDRVRVVALHDRVDRPLAVTAGGVYVAGAGALYRVGLDGDKPVRAWASAYDGGERGSAPVPLPGGLVAVADNKDPRLQVVLHRADTGEVACRAEVFEDDHGATDGGLVAAGDSVVVQNSHGYDGPGSTILGRTTSRGIARVDPDCTVAWTTEMNAPSGGPAVSTADGLVYVWTKRHSWLGVDAWYLSALDLRTGRLSWARRTGLTPLADNHGGTVVLGPDRSVYAPVLGGLVRVRDRV